MLIDSGKLSRKNFLQILGLLGLGSSIGFNILCTNKKKYNIPGKIVGANAELGHLLRTGIKEKPTETRTVDTIIVGGGISALSAGWWLLKNKYNKFLILEMDEEVGGNSRYGENQISKYPWGAHYVPLPSENAVYVRMLFEELGIIKGYQGTLPYFDEYYLCADPHERLYFQGKWQSGLVPQYAVTNEDTRQYEAFFGLVESLKKTKGKDGKYIFQIPMELSSQDSEYLGLDKISMSDFMKSKGWTSKYLNWYVDYCCRDDYGVSRERVSAWAGLHYFASRVGSGANADSQSVITWPEGNGWLTNQLEKINRNNVQKNSLVYKIDIVKNDKVYVEVLDAISKKSVRYEAKNIIFSAPRFLAKKIINGYHLTAQDKLEYSPWLVANISLKNRPAGPGAALAWDNVSYYSDSLGYIVANHQDLTTHRKDTVITYYLPLDASDPKTSRTEAYRKTHQDWMETLIPDLEKMHPGIENEITNVDLWVWGHGMISPGIDYLWSEKRKEMLKPFGPIHFAHTDMSGISIFEEAQYRGVMAAREILTKVS